MQIRKKEVYITVEKKKRTDRSHFGGKVISRSKCVNMSRPGILSPGSGIECYQQACRRSRTNCPLPEQGARTDGSPRVGVFSVVNAFIYIIIIVGYAVFWSPALKA
uniref:Uncharacterized protein n=1 Tax=Anopheles culicifacies TaxID=139723 RepID=A0A182M305_9DIPT